jgi:hypothetical protein
VDAVLRFPGRVTHAEEGEATRNALLVEGEILPAENRFHNAHAASAHQPFGRSPRR